MSRPSRADAVRAHLDRFIFSEDVQVGTSPRDARARSASTVRSRGDSVLGRSQPAIDLAALPLLGNVRAARCRQRDAIVVRSDEPGVAGLRRRARSARRRRRSRPRCRRLAPSTSTADAARPSGSKRAAAVRRRHGRRDDSARSGIEDRAISRTKGCYVGQEVIVRVLDRGHGRVARRLVGLGVRRVATVPAAGTRSLAGERDIGRVTSAARSPALGASDRARLRASRLHRSRDDRDASTGADAAVAALPFVA